MSLDDPELALDLDLAIAQRCHIEEQRDLQKLLEDQDAGFFSAVIALLNRR